MNMNEFAEKLIERLEEKKENLFKLSQYFPYSRDREYGIEEAISIVKELAEEYAKDTNVPTNNGWIPFTQRKLSKEEKEEMQTDFEYILDCKLPDDDEEILICSKFGSVFTDTFFNDCGECYLDSGYDFIDDAIAWQPLPPAYQPKGE